MAARVRVVGVCEKCRRDISPQIQASYEPEQAAEAGAAAARWVVEFGQPQTCEQCKAEAQFMTCAHGRSITSNCEDCRKDAQYRNATGHA